MNHAQGTEKLYALRNQVMTMIPDDAVVSNLWTGLGWDQEASDQYLNALRLGIDLRPLLAPVFSELVSLVVDEYYTEYGYSWTDILHGDVPEFAGETPKKVVLAVINYAIKSKMA